MTYSLQQSTRTGRRRGRVALAGPLAFVLAVGALVFGVAGRAAPVAAEAAADVVAVQPAAPSPASRRSSLARPAALAPSSRWRRR